MAVTVTEVYDDTYLNMDDTAMGSASRCFMVEGLTVDKPSKMLNAGIVACNCPFNAPHPDIARLYVKGYRSAFAGQGGPTTSKQVVRVQVLYESPTGSTLNYTKIEIIGSNGTKILNRWPSGAQLAGQPILLGYNPTVQPNGGGKSFPAPINPAGLVTDPNKNGGNYYDTVEIPILSPNTIIRFTRTEPHSPLNTSAKFRRTVNATPLWGFDKWTLLCRAIDAQNLVGSGNLYAPNLWATIYEFEYDPEGWVRVEFFKDIHTGKPPAGVNLLDKTNNGYLIVLPYGQTDFRQLRLPSPL